jgi:hypothetical protein
LHCNANLWYGVLSSGEEALKVAESHQSCHLGLPPKCDEMIFVFPNNDIYLYLEIFVFSTNVIYTTLVVFGTKLILNVKMKTS